MTAFERIYLLLTPFDHPLHQYVHRTLKSLTRRVANSPSLLDVGGRRSAYTIGLKARVWITDVPRKTRLQQSLDLGATDEIQSTVTRRRTNVEAYLYDDMTQTQLPASRFDIVSAIEVLEHVEEDKAFLANVAGVLRPQGYFFMTSPNGDFRPTPYPDHKRHYRARDLEALLRVHFSKVSVGYRVNFGRLFSLGLHSPSFATPIRSLVGMLAFAMSAIIERIGAGGKGPEGKLHLYAICQKID
jgi:SAM-dependent methyltransferase